MKRIRQLSRAALSAAAGILLVFALLALFLLPIGFAGAAVLDFTKTVMTPFPPAYRVERPTARSEAATGMVRLFSRSRGQR